ncbi:flagellar basal body P-ring formation chaperone FlgA [Crenobacter sp. SG2305]|uniref:flagellar basal body P-ring formation chaperone FlgA n=1 Tax=Crenobacter oryzisoli TaxID=3056844 RepID=UPI0025AB10B9|nr:flagellar basal body P-ring formation chaperone FlgA [Crenobacter sp. SG2305]MDN0084402.1 flagellar basal body P-ring formation chaperone FlgA [Crenobacter sp. SG2305]
MSNRIFALLFFVLVGHVLAAVPAAAPVESALRRFLDAELQHRKASYQIGPLSSFDGLQPCPQPPRVSWPPGAQPSGSTQVSVACPSIGWVVKVPVTISETRYGMVTTRAIGAGEVLADTDVQRVVVPNPTLARSVLQEPGEVVGQSARSGIPAGSWLRAFMLRPPQVVKAGQKVQVHAGGDGFAVLADGIANRSAAAGEVVAVRMGSGRLVQGVAQKDGTVQVQY